MCGILGQIVKNGYNIVNQNDFTEALNLQHHRGPDDFGVLAGEKYIFGHRRLSIIDLAEQSKQPMSVCDGIVTIVFNGEIYNYKEIREELISRGYVFNTDGDTEVILNSYLEYGIDCIQHFIGMFAFSILDKKNGCTYIVRDRLGIKPVYLLSDENGVCFSSEIKSILHLFPEINELNQTAVSSYLSFRYPILNDTFFNGITSLPAGHYIKIDEKGGIEEVEYWDLKESFSQQAEDKGEEYYLNKLREILRSAVRYRMISDVPFGAFLSGGVDSSVITAIMAQESDTPISTFTIGFEDEGFNEFEYAKLVADKYSTNHREIVLSGSDYVDTMEKLIGYKDAPLSVPNEVPLYLMSKELRKYITVVLSGEGADEIFGGYGRIFRSAYDYERAVEVSSGKYSEEEKQSLINNLIKKYNTNSFENELDHFMSIYSYTTREEKESLLHPDFPHKRIEKQLHAKFQGYFDDLEGECYENKMMYVFEKVHLIGLLQRVDMTTMATSVEARVPFVDHRLVEFAFSLPLHYKLRWKSNEDELAAKLLMSSDISEVHDTPKYLLKKAYEGVVPNEVLYRKKMGFPVPLNNWFGGEFNNYASKILLSDKADCRKLYNIKSIKNLLNNSTLSDDHSLALKLWMLINLELFCQKYLD